MNKFCKIVVSSIIIGGLTDLFLWQMAINSRHDFIIGFTVIIPVSIIIVSLILRSIDLEKPWAMTIIYGIIFVLDMILGFGLFNVREGYVSDMYGLVYMVGFLPALIIGLIFGFLVSKTKVN